MIFSILKFWFSGFSGDWKSKKWPTVTIFSVLCFYIFRNCRSYQRDFDNDISRCFSFFKKMQYCKYYNYFVFYWPTSAVFLIIICFSSSSINAKKKFWGVPYLLHICGIFTFLCSSVCLCVSQSVCLWVFLQSISIFQKLIFMRFPVMFESKNDKNAVINIWWLRLSSWQWPEIGLCLAK